MHRRTILTSKGWQGIFNVRSELCACCAHQDEAGTDEFLQKYGLQPRPRKEFNLFLIIIPLIHGLY